MLGCVKKKHAFEHLYLQESVSASPVGLGRGIFLRTNNEIGLTVEISATTKGFAKLFSHYSS